MRYTAGVKDSSGRETQHPILSTRNEAVGRVNCVRPATHNSYEQQLIRLHHLLCSYIHSYLLDFSYSYSTNIMPKVTKVAKASEARTSPVKVVKPKKPATVVSTNNKLPTITVDPAKLEALSALSKFKETGGSEAVEFDAFFVRQDKFGRFQFNLTEDEFNNLTHVVENDLEYTGTKSCLLADSYSGHNQIMGKLAKEYIEAAAGGQVPIPADKTNVHVEGVIKTALMRGDPLCFFQITALSTLA